VPSLDLPAQRRDRPFSLALALCLLAVWLLGGCAAFRSYESELGKTLDIAAQSGIDAALRSLDDNNRGKRDLLYHLERGELLRLNNDYTGSTAAWQEADAAMLEWESAGGDLDRFVGSMLSYIVNDKFRPYEGHDFEKVMLTTRIAMNHLARGDWDKARVAVKRSHERESIIAQLRAKLYEKVENEWGKQSNRKSFKDIGGYPVKTIDNAAVNQLRNGYQSAFSHFLAGFTYEALGEPSLAAAGYRQALELAGDLPVLRDALAGLDERSVAADDASSDVLFVLETGLAPARQSQEFRIAIPVEQQDILVSIAYPVLVDQGSDEAPPEMYVGDGVPLRASRISSFDHMARRSLQDDMPGIMLRSVLRATSKAMAQYLAMQQAKQAKKTEHGIAAALAAIAVTAVGAVTETSDERAWRSLPASVSVVRMRLPRGTQVIRVEMPDGRRQKIKVDIGGRHAFVAMRFVKGRIYAMLPPKKKRK
jgi:hypothetical protein